MDKVEAYHAVRPFPHLMDSKGQSVKLVEEASELLYAVNHGTYEEAVEEIGDVMQATVNLAEVMGIDLKDAIAQANERNEARGRFK